MAKLMNGTITFADANAKPLTFKTASRIEGRRQAARKLCLPGSSDEHLDSKGVLRIYVDGKEVYSAKERRRIERNAEIALENGECPKRPTPLRRLVERCKVRRLAMRSGHRPIALATLPEELAAV